MQIKKIAVLAAGLWLALSSYAADVSSAYRKDFAKWKAELTEDREKNWLTLVGLFWLEDGTNRVGGDQMLEVPLPKEKVPARVGVIEFHAGKAVFTAAEGAKVTSSGKAVSRIEMKPDVSGNPTVLQIGDIKMLLIQRGEKYGIRVRDAHSETLQHFKGLDFYPLNSNYIVKAKFIPDAKPHTVKVPTVLGQDAEMDSVGHVEFSLNGKKQHLHALTEGDGQMFFIIKDQTAGHGTYPAGRFLYTAMPKNGEVVMDFNKAHNPPCAWTPYATCPLPPKENYMTVKVEAGEKYAGSEK